MFIYYFSSIIHVMRGSNSNLNEKDNIMMAKVFLKENVKVIFKIIIIIIIIILKGEHTIFIYKKVARESSYKQSKKL